MFESVLQQGKSARRLGAGTAVSVLLHLGILGGALSLGGTTQAAVKSDREVVFMTARAPLLPPPAPPLPAPRSGSGRITPKKRQQVEKKLKPEKLRQPKEIPVEKPPEVPEKAEEEPDQAIAQEDSKENGVEGGVPGGVAGGVPGGVIGGVGGGSGSALGGGIGGAVLPFGEGMTLPQLKSGNDPIYTREALEARVEGTMVVKCVITTEGALQNCRVVKPLPHMAESVLAALSTKRYTPVMFQGQAVAVNYVFNIKLMLPR